MARLFRLTHNKYITKPRLALISQLAPGAELTPNGKRPRAKNGFILLILSPIFSLILYHLINNTPPPNFKPKPISFAVSYQQPVFYQYSRRHWPICFSYS